VLEGMDRLELKLSPDNLEAGETIRNYRGNDGFTDPSLLTINFAEYQPAVKAVRADLSLQVR
jgi:hypothetical protein